MGQLVAEDARPAAAAKLYRQKSDGKPYVFGVPRASDKPIPCPHDLQVERGARYLVFRDVAGRPFWPFWFTALAQDAPDPWLAAVREAARVRPAPR